METRDLLKEKETKDFLIKKESLGKLIRVKRKADKVFSFLALLASLVGLLFIAFFFLDILLKGLRWIDLQFLLGTPSRFAKNAGIFPALVGSLWLLLLTAVFSVPLGIATAIYLEEYSPEGPIARFIKINISNLAGVPSIIYGILGLALFVRFLALGRSILSGGLTLSLVVLPLIIIASQEALKAVPQTLREASFSLGASKWQTIRFAVLPAAFPGILTGIILALARAIGETAPLITIGALSFVVSIPRGPLDPFTALPIQIYSWSSRPKEEFREIAAAAIIVLLFLLLVFNALAVILRYRTKKRMGQL